MRSIPKTILAAIVAFTISTAIAEEPTLRSDLENQWTVLQFGPWYWGGDTSYSGPYFLVQKLPDDRWLLSKHRADLGVSQVPVPIRYLSEKDVETIAVTLLRYYEIAEKEESYLEKVRNMPADKRKEIFENLPLLTETLLEVFIYGPDLYNRHSTAFADDGDAEKGFAKFLKSLGHAKPKKD